MLGPPAAVVAVARMVLVPAARVTVAVAVAQVSQLPVPRSGRCKPPPRALVHAPVWYAAAAS